MGYFSQPEKEKNLMTLKYGDLFSKDEIAIVKGLVADFQKTTPDFKQDDFKDLVQECLIDWHEKKEKYDSEKAESYKSFLREIVRNKLKDLIKGYRRDKRKVFYQSLSFDEIETDRDFFIEKDFRSSVDLKYDLSEVISRLTPNQKEICKLILEEGLSYTEIAKGLNKHRTSIFREIKRIKELFESKGLKKYLK